MTIPEFLQALTARAPLPKATPDELVSDLEHYADTNFLTSYPHLDRQELVETDAANFIKSATKLLRDIIAAGGDYAERARRVLNRED